MRVEIPGPAGLLEGDLRLQDGEGPFPGVVVCHPHPQMGGDMNNNVVMAICHYLGVAGFVTLPFNFRGVGRSQGAYDEGRGEVEDVLAALAFLAGQDSVLETGVGLAGYSFGAGMALRAALKADLVRAVSMVGRARVDPEDNVESRPSLPMLFVVGDRDRLMPAERFEELQAKLATPPEMHVVPGADHFYQGQESEAAQPVTAFFQKWLGA